MAGYSNEKFQGRRQGKNTTDGAGKSENKFGQQDWSKKQFTDLQCELDPLIQDYEQLKLEDLYEDAPPKGEKKQDKRLAEIEGKGWKTFAKNIVEYTKNGGNYITLKESLESCLEKMEEYDGRRAVGEGLKIVTAGHIGLINKKRLGYMPSDEVGWGELNSAFQDATMVLCLLSNKLDLRFQNFFPVPQKSAPFIIVLSDQRVLPLFGDGEFTEFKNKDFDDALVAFIDCMKQLHVELKKAHPDETLQIPHEIVGDKIIDFETDRPYTVRLQQAFNHRRWSRAMKLLLEDLHWLVKWAIIF